MSLPQSGHARNSDLFYKQHHNNPVFQSDDLVLIKLWNYCCERARISSGTIKWNREYLRLEKGQFLFGRFKASKDLNLSQWKIRDRVKKLIDMELIRKVGEKQGKLGYSIYQITSLEEYSHQSPPKESPQASPSIPKKVPPQITKPGTEPVCEDFTSTKKKDKPLKEKTNKQEKRKVPRSKPLKEEDVCLSHPVIIQNDFKSSLQRFGQDFLDFLLEKAKKFSNNPTNPIGLLIHMLRTGAYRAEYADIQKQRKQTQELNNSRKQLEEQEKENQRQQQEEMEKALNQSKELLQEDEEFRSQVKARICSTLRFMKTFLGKILPEGFTVEDILENQRALAYYSRDLQELLQLRGNHAGSISH